MCRASTALNIIYDRKQSEFQRNSNEFFEKKKTFLEQNKLECS